ncbi:hypothetical protein K469DRAFT_693894 [Zopfia rhizophila CBS 207.26]|uniref:Uncharacterized protein n=1 Tax=Zopfia rhizophila CBS 207.26 TaxID=1314779 RepID=A0A6A6DMQ1_9PEZI|nr:hypothetical protein K469DRAFT_693894 [Zopfia rhizophila CBS 207.26]
MSSKLSHLLRGPGRYACITTALAFTMLSLSCLIVVLVSGLRTPNGKLGWLSFAVSLYDLFRPWKVWGASVHKDGTRFYWLEKGPKLLYIAYLIAGGTTILEVFAGVSSLYTNRVSRATLALSSVASASLLTTAILAQVTYGLLISRADDENIPITAKKAGQILYAANWVGTVFSLFALVLWCHVLAGNTIKRAATIETTSYTRGQATGVDSPILARPLVETPVRKRTFSMWPQY